MNNKRRIIDNNIRKTFPRGITPEVINSTIKKIGEAKRESKVLVNNKTRSNMGRLKKHAGINKKEKTLPPREITKYLTNIAEKIISVNLPEPGSFNAGLVEIPNKNGYVCAYRPDEYRFKACLLTPDMQPKEGSFFKFSFKNCADPRLIWKGNKLFMFYSSTSEVGLRHECIRGSLIMDLDKSDSFVDNAPFRVSPETLQDRQKNWMPFLYEDKFYLIGSVCPHIIYEFDEKNLICEKKFETKWDHPWMYQEFLRGNTNIVMLEDGNYLGTFHTATWYNRKCYYDNGCYVFEGKPPFRVLRCSNRTYLPAEGATEKSYRGKENLVCTFPVGMVRNGNRLLISYGDNDSMVKILDTTVEKMFETMLDIY